jgi:hypothetical protein
MRGRPRRVVLLRRGLDEKSVGHESRVAPLGTDPRPGSPTLVAVPLSLRLVLGSLLVLAGVALLAVAVLAARGRLRRNAWVGVRTATTLRSQQSFAVGNSAAAVPAGAAGAVAVAGGAVLLAGPGGALGWVVLAVTVVGMLGLAGVAGMVGDRAAGAVEVRPAGPVCSGSCAGCDLVAGCRDAAAPTLPAGSERG